MIVKMSLNINVSPIEKIISTASYLTFGMVGMVWLIISYLLKKQLRYFLMYNIAQSMLISILFAIINIALGVIFRIFAIVPFLGIVAAKINLLISTPVIRMPFMSFSVIPLIVTLLLIYIVAGIIVGRIFYVPLLSNIMNKAMSSYR